MIPLPGAVEISKSGSFQVWYAGHLRDALKDGRLSIGFDGGVWPDENFKPAHVRKPPKRTDAEPDSFNVGDQVELLADASDHAPASGCRATVKKVTHGLYYVLRSADGSKENGKEEIVERAKLRPIHEGPTLSESWLKKDTFALPARLTSWSITDDASGCFQHIEEQAGLALLKPNTKRQELLMLGDEKSLKAAKLLLEVHMKHQTQIQSFQEVREKRLKALEERRNRVEGAGFKHSAEVKVSRQYIARVIGKGGENIRSLEERHDVSIRVMEGRKDAEEETIRIFAKSEDALHAAREDIEYVEDTMDVPSDMHAWVIGRGGKTITDMKSSAGLVYLKLDRDGEQLKLCGPRKAIDEAMAMVETHLLYFPVFNQMDEEMEEILSKLEECGDWNARKDWPKSWDTQEQPRQRYQEWAR
mmetsp:Transcript_643/g.1316  ORF Transcript_643/g.1316 Transcript_643/m.1316 type:complete len:417 (+) Transcript_643:50-1300(+)